jgi:hypothetical protein
VDSATRKREVSTVGIASTNSGYRASGRTVSSCAASSSMAWRVRSAVFDSHEAVVCDTKIDWRTERKTNKRTSILSGTVSVFSVAVNQDNWL